MKSISIKSFCRNTLSSYVSFVRNVLTKLNISYKIIKLPVKEKRITLLKSPHVFKKAKEHFKFSSFKTVIFIHSNHNNFLEQDLSYFILNKPKSVFVKIRA